MKQAAIYVLCGLGSLVALWLLINVALITVAATGQHISAAPKFVRRFPGKAAAICAAGIIVGLLLTTLGLGYPWAIAISVAVTAIAMIRATARALPADGDT
jgi:uncharacterized membrane protein